MQRPQFQTLKDLMKSHYNTEFSKKFISYGHKNIYVVKSIIWYNNAQVNKIFLSISPVF